MNTHSNTVPHPTPTPSSGPPPQQRRLAEFATFLGDIKLAISVWEALRKEGRGGSVCQYCPHTYTSTQH